MPRRVLLISNMYPSAGDSTYGLFVQRCRDGLINANIVTDLVSMPKHRSVTAKLLDYARFSAEANIKILLSRYDCIYIHHPLHSLLACLPALWIRKTRVVLNFHGHDLLPVTVRGRIMLKALSGQFRASDAILVPSKHFKAVFDNLYAKENLPPSWVFYSGGVNDLYLAGKVLSPQARGRTALFLSRWVEEKGWSDFLTIAKRLRASYADFQFTVAGTGPDEHKIKAAIHEKGLDGCVRLTRTTGASTNRNLYTSHRYFIFPSRFDESLALVNLEAMASGCIVLSSSFQAARDYLNDGFNGYSIDLRHFVDVCYQRICELESRAEEAPAISDRARRTANAFSDSTVMSELPVLLLPPQRERSQ